MENPLLAYETPVEQNGDILYWARVQLEALLRKGSINRDQLVELLRELREE